jgi:hypothetical protein
MLADKVSFSRCGIVDDQYYLDFVWENSKVLMASLFTSTPGRPSNLTRPLAPQEGRTASHQGQFHAGSSRIRLVSQSIDEIVNRGLAFRVLREAVRIFVCQTSNHILWAPSATWPEDLGAQSNVFKRFCTQRKCREAAKFGGGLGAVQPEIALLGAAPAIRCILCTWRKAA